MSDSLPSTGFACNPLAMNAVQRQRHEVVARQLFQMVHEVKPTADGYGFRWENDQLGLAAEFISRERLCCPFFNFTLSVEADSESFLLHIGGSEGVKAFIRAEFGEVLASDLFPE